MSGALVYLYAVTAAPVREWTDAERPAGLEGAPLRAVEEGELAAIVSDVSAVDYAQHPLDANVRDGRWLTPRATTHQEVNAAAHAALEALLPVAFGTIYRSDERVREMIIERNLFLPGPEVQVALMLWGRDITVRDNLFQRGPHRDCVGGGTRGIEPSPDAILLVHNTCYTEESNTGPELANFDSTTTNLTLYNNLLAGPNASLSNLGSPISDEAFLKMTAFSYSTMLRRTLRLTFACLPSSEREPISPMVRPAITTRVLSKRPDASRNMAWYRLAFAPAARSPTVFHDM